MHCKGVSGRQNRIQSSATCQTRRRSRGLRTTYIMAIGACALLIASYVMYFFHSTGKPWYPVSDNGEVSFERQSITVKRPPPVLITHSPLNTTAPPTEDHIERSFQPSAIIDVPGVGLRYTPGFEVKAMLGNLKRGKGWRS